MDRQTPLPGSLQYRSILIDQLILVSYCEACLSGVTFTMTYFRDDQFWKEIDDVDLYQLADRYCLNVANCAQRPLYSRGGHVKRLTLIAS